MKKIVALMLCMLVATSIYSQGNMKTRTWRKSQIDSLKSAEAFFEDQNFELAIPLLLAIQKEHTDELYLKYVTGISCLFRTDLHEHALHFLMEVYAKNQEAEDVEYYLAKAYHYNYKFDEGIALLDNYLKRKNLSSPQKRNAGLLLEYCRNAKHIMNTPTMAKIKAMPEGINSAYSEYLPLLSSDENTLVITYRGERSTGGLLNDEFQPDPLGAYHEDIFTAEKQGDRWLKPVSIGSNINTTEHEAAIALSTDGQQLFIYKYNETNGGDIYLSVLKGNKWLEPQALKGEVNSTEWEGSASLTSDGKTLYFSSERPGGFGGKDIYRAKLLADGSWGNVENLGMTVNTVSDDDSPFIHPDGKTLFYSSKGLNSMGGFDVYCTKLNTDGNWTSPQNLGYPINTTDDDLCFVLSADGSKGYYSSGKAGGFGLQDLYEIEMPANFEKPVIGMIHGKTSLDGKPAEVTIDVSLSDSHSKYGTFYSNSFTGNYLLNLPAGNSYLLTYKFPNFPDQVQQIDLRDLKSFMEKTIELKYTASDSVAKKND